MFFITVGGKRYSLMHIIAIILTMMTEWVAVRLKEFQLITLKGFSVFATSSNWNAMNGKFLESPTV